MWKYDLGYYLIMSLGFTILIIGIGFILKKFVFKKFIENEDKDFEDED